MSSLSAGNGLSWFSRAIDLGGRNPRALFGGAVLAVVAFLVLMLFGLLLSGLWLGMRYGGDIDQVEIVSLMLGLLPMLLLGMAAGPVLVAGITRVIDEVERGRPVGAGSVFAVLAGGRLPSLLALALIPLLGMLISLSFDYLLGGPDYLAQHVTNLEQLRDSQIPVPPEAQHPGWLLLAGLALAIVQNLLQLLCVPLVQLSRLSMPAAVLAALSAIFRNPLAFAVAIAVTVAGGLVLVIVLAVLFAMLALLASLLPLLGVPLLLLATTAIAAVLLVIYAGVGYFAWRDLWGALGGTPSPLADVEA